MKKFLILYMAPAGNIEEWMKTPEAERKAAEKQMQDEWNAWMKAHHIAETAGVGKTKRVTKGKVEDAKNDIMLFSVIEAESHEEAADLFTDHPHFGIPGAWIEVCPANYLPGKENA